MAGAERARKNAPPREDVLAAAMEMIAERGLEKLTMAALGREVGMSSGHLLYYFHSKDELLLRTLEWSEGRLGVARGRLLTRPGTARERLDAYVDLYVPEGHRDPHWTLWLEVPPATGRPPSRAPGTAISSRCSPRGSRAVSSVPSTPTASPPGCAPSSTVSPSTWRSDCAARTGSRCSATCGSSWRTRSTPRPERPAGDGVPDARGARFRTAAARILRRTVSRGTDCARLPTCSRSP